MKLLSVFATFNICTAKTSIKIRVAALAFTARATPQMLLIYNNTKKNTCQVSQSLQTLTKLPCKQKENRHFWHSSGTPNWAFQQVVKIRQKPLFAGKFNLPLTTVFFEKLRKIFAFLLTMPLDFFKKNLPKSRSKLYLPTLSGRQSAISFPRERAKKRRFCALCTKIRGYFLAPLKLLIFFEFSQNHQIKAAFLHTHRRLCTEFLRFCKFKLVFYSYFHFLKNPSSRDLSHKRQVFRS